MKTLVCKQPGYLEYIDTTLPNLKPGYATILVKRVGICGTDLHAFDGTQPYFLYPRVLGHEVSGQLVEVNGPTSIQPGTMVTFVPYLSCGHCIACRLHKPNCCVQLQVCGVHIDGAMTQYYQVPVSALVDGQGLTNDQLALVEPLAIGAHGIERAAVTPGEFVLVIGAGPIGLGTMEFARIAGGQVIAMDVNEDRLKFCDEKLQITHTINARNTDVLQQLSELTNGDMPTVVIDATGNNAAIKNAFTYMAHGARYVLVGLQKNDICFSHPGFHKREATLMSSRNATHKNFEQVIAAIKTDKVNPANYITHTINFNHVASQFAELSLPENKVIKAMITFG